MSLSNVADQKAHVAGQGMERDNKRSTWILIGIVAVATIISVLSVPEQSSQTDQIPSIRPPDAAPSLLPVEPQPQAASDATGQMEVSGGPSAASIDAPSATPRDAPAGDLARELIKQWRAKPRIDLDQVYQAAQDFQDRELDEDAYLLMFFAAREGSGEAALALAKKFDPATFKAGGLPGQADELQAHKWYGIAIEAGMLEARSARQALRARVEQAAAAGDSRARRIALQWN